MLVQQIGPRVELTLDQNYRQTGPAPADISCLVMADGAVLETSATALQEAAFPCLQRKVNACQTSRKILTAGAAIC